MKIDIQKICSIALQAGSAILEVYRSNDFHVEMKGDDSPLTLADKASHEIIQNELTKIFPNIPLISEEGITIPYEERKSWPCFWLIDPLDGTKEFIRKNGEFTVNIALIENNQPIASVIYAPDMDLLYYGQMGEGAFKHIQNRKTIPIRVDSEAKNGLIAVKSRSHSSDEEQAVLSKYPIRDRAAIGSSLKFCLVAEGRAHLYYRHGPTWEWDTAAGHAIVEAAGGMVQNLTYNKKNLLNSSFLVSAKAISNSLA